MSSLRMLRSFAVELIKSAADIKDADVQKLLAERSGVEYLPGGKLPSNQEDALYLRKMGGYQSHIGMTASDNYDLKARKKKNNTYQHLRDYTTTGMKGGLTGLGILGASNAMKGRFGSPAAGIDTIRAAKAARRAAAIGGSAAIVDRAYRHNDITKEALVNPGLNTSFKSPKSELTRGQETGKFESKVVHDYGKPPKTVQLGKKFRIPGAL